MEKTNKSDDENQREFKQLIASLKESEAEEAIDFLLTLKALNIQ